MKVNLCSVDCLCIIKVEIRSLDHTNITVTHSITVYDQYCKYISEIVE